MVWAPYKYKFLLLEFSLDKNLDFIALLVSRRRDCSHSFLKNIYGGNNFLWHVKSPQGKSGGVVLGINFLTFDIGEIEEETASLSLKYEARSMALNYFYCLYIWCSIRRK